MKKIILSIGIILILILNGPSFGINDNYNYTNSSDFEKGNIIGLEYNTTPHQLQLDNPPETLPFIWVPNSNQGTVSKIDVKTGNELARYRTGPENLSSDPSRTTIDLYGNCWVANRQTGSLIKIGLYENGQYQDHNGNGIIETSYDTDGNGLITNDELMPWGEDECVITETILIPGYESTWRPGTFPGVYANNTLLPGPRGIAVDPFSNIWAGTFASMKYYYINGSNGQILKTVDVSSVNHTAYGALIDNNGLLWSSGSANGNNILVLDPQTNLFSRLDLPHQAYALALDRSNHLYVSGYEDCVISCIDILTGTIQWTKPAPYGTKGILVTDDDDGDIWTADCLSNSITRYNNQGDIKTIFNLGIYPTGLSMDNEGFVWVLDYGDGFIYRIDPFTENVVLAKELPGTLHYGYSDMTGAISRTITTKLGTWTINHDSQFNYTPWGQISWSSFVPNGTLLNIMARSSQDNITWSQWEQTTNGFELQNTPNGRYIQIQTILQILEGKTSPILYDLDIKAKISDLTLDFIMDKDVYYSGDNVNILLNINNQGPSTARNLTLLTNFSNLKNIQYSSNGYQWTPYNSNISLNDLNSFKMQAILFKGEIPANYQGNIQSSAQIFSTTLDLNLTNNQIFKTFIVNQIPSTSNPNQNINPNLFQWDHSVLIQYIDAMNNVSTNNTFLLNAGTPIGQYPIFKILGKILELGFNFSWDKIEPWYNLIKYDLEAWEYNTRGPSIYGAYGNTLKNIFNPLAAFFYTWDKFGLAACKAWETGNIWDFFDYNFWHFYGYNNLDKMWGGGSIKFIGEIFGVDEKGNLSVAGFILLILSILPTEILVLLGRLPALGPKFLNIITKSRIFEFFVQNKYSQYYIRMFNDFLTPFKKIFEPLFEKIPIKLDLKNLGNIWSWIVESSNIINLNVKSTARFVQNIVDRIPFIGKSLNFAWNKFLIFFEGKLLPGETNFLIENSLRLLKGDYKGILTSFVESGSKITTQKLAKSPIGSKLINTILPKSSIRIINKISSAVTTPLKRIISINSVIKAIDTVKDVIDKGFKSISALKPKIIKQSQILFKKVFKPLSKHITKIKVASKLTSIGKMVVNGVKSAFGGFKKAIRWR